MIRDVMEAAPDRVERVNDISPKAADAFIGICDELVEEVGRRIDAFWTKRAVKGAPATDLFDEPAGHA